MSTGNERVRLIQEELQRAGLDALVTGLPTNVLLLSGYWPVLGTAVALVSRSGKVGLTAPEDERDLAQRAWADELHFFGPSSLEDRRDALELMRGTLAKCLRVIEPGTGQVGLEAGPVTEPSPYAAFNLYGPSLAEAVRWALPSVTITPAAESFARLRSVLTTGELRGVRAACQIAGHAFDAGAGALRAGMTEAEVAAGFRTPLSIGGMARANVQRADGFVACMSGPNSARAFGSYARSRARVVAPGELLLVHCNSYVDGLWTDITRTYCLAAPSARQCEMYAAVLAARDAALGNVRQGVEAQSVDRAVREVLAARGFGDAFKHPTGHGVGFAAIDHNARPRLGPGSPDVLSAGMVCNIEPAIYLNDAGGLRHCDVVAVTESGAELLTPFHASLEDLVLPLR